MDASTLCLGVLCLGDATGYEIRKQFEEGPFSQFQDAGFGSIYPALRKLTERGLVGFTHQAQEQRPDRKVYAISPAGRLAFYDALLVPPGLDKLRSDFLFVLFYAHLLPARLLEQVIEHRCQWYRERLARMEACGDHAAAPAGMRFVHGMGQAVYGAALDYLEAHKYELLSESLKSELSVAE